MINITHHTPTKTPTFPARSLVLYGQPKIGKTNCAGHFPAPLFIDLENGLTNITTDLIGGVRTSAQLLECLKDLGAELRAGRAVYSTIILDGLSTFAVSTALANKRKDARAVAKDLAAAFIPALQEFFSLPGIRIVTMHSRLSSYEKRVEGKMISYVEHEPDLSPRVRAYLTGVADAIGYCHSFNNTPVVEWLEINTLDDQNAESDHRHIVAGNRLGLPQRTELSYAAIAKHLTAPVKASPTLPTTTKPTPPTAPQATEKITAPQPPSVPDGAEWCKWCGNRPSVVGLPCETCYELGARAETQPAPVATTKPTPPTTTQQHTAEITYYEALHTASEKTGELYLTMAISELENRARFAQNGKKAAAQKALKYRLAAQRKTPTGKIYDDLSDDELVIVIEKGKSESIAAARAVLEYRQEVAAMKNTSAMKQPPAAEVVQAALADVPF